MKIPLFTLQTNFYKIIEFVSWYRDGILTLTPKFQRRSVWQSGAKSYLIDTIVRGLPIPIILLRDKIDANNLKVQREVIDGQQRLRTVIA